MKGLKIRMLKLYIGLAVAGVVFAVKNSNYWSFKQNIVKAMEDQESQGNNLQSDSSKINLEAPPNSDVKSKVGSIENSSAKAQKDKDFFSEKLVAPNSHFTKLEEKDLVLRENLPKINGKGKDIDFSTKFAIEKVNKLLPENVLPLKIQRKVPIMVGEFSKFRLNLLKPILTNPPVLLLIELSDHLRKIASVEYLEVVRKYISDYNKFKGSGDLKLKDLYVATEKVMHELELICYKFDRLASKLFKVYGEFVAFYDNLSKTCGGSEFGYAIKHFKEAVYFRNEVNKEKESYRNKVKSAGRCDSSISIARSSSELKRIYHDFGRDFQSHSAGTDLIGTILRTASIFAKPLPVSFRYSRSPSSIILSLLLK